MIFDKVGKNFDDYWWSFFIGDVVSLYLLKVLFWFFWHLIFFLDSVFNYD